MKRVRTKAIGENESKDAVKRRQQSTTGRSTSHDNGSTAQADSAGKAKVPPTRTASKSFAQGKHNASSFTSTPQTVATAHKLVSISSLLKNSPQTDAPAHKLVSISSLLKNSPHIDETAHKLVSMGSLLQNSAQMNACLKHKGPHLKKGLMATSSFNSKGVSSNTQANPKSRAVIRRTSSAPVVDKNSTIPHPTMSSGRVVNQGFQTTSTRYDKVKGVEASPPPSTSTNMCAAVAPAQVRSLENDLEPGTATSRLPAKKTLTGCTPESNCVLENEVHRNKNVLKNNDHSKSDVAKTTNLDRKFTQTSSEVKPKHHIRWNGILYLFADTPLMPHGERCPLCNIDLAFPPKGSDSLSDGVMCSAVLPCSHSYHDCCLQNVFGPYEPPCIRCLDVRAIATN